MRLPWTALLALFLSFAAQAGPVLIENVRIFNGVDNDLTSGSLLIVDGSSENISATPIAAPDDAIILAGNNRILTPGFIDLHVHLGMHSPSGLWREHAKSARAGSPIYCSMKVNCSRTCRCWPIRTPTLPWS